MKQLLQHLGDGRSVVANVPAPQPQPGRVLIRVHASLVSAGTERMVVEFAEKHLVEKARARPDLVRQTLDKMRHEGVLATVEAVRSRLDAPMALGYSVAGTVLNVGEGMTGLKLGDPVVAAGGGHAVHAEVVSVPRNLVVALPSTVPFEEGAFATLGATALHGLRLGDPHIGEWVAVIGLGVLGQLAVQVARAAGGRVLALDPQLARAALARRGGAEQVATSADELEQLCSYQTDGRGVDVVLIAADTTDSEPVSLAGRIARDRGVVVALGNVGFDLPRTIYYQKELDFRVSRSYGPGRYDPSYEEAGRDYPYGYVRWTEARNIQAFVDLLAGGRVSVQPLITHRFEIEDGQRAYALIAGQTGEPFVGVVLTYPDNVAAAESTVVLERRAPAPGSKSLSVGVIGAGNFARATLLPAIRRAGGARLLGVCAATGASAQHAASRFGFGYCTTDAQRVIEDPAVEAVVIATRHNLHARQAVASLDAGKHTFVEKPPCLDEDELSALKAAVKRSDRLFMVGFNRRFAPLSTALKRFLGPAHEPVAIQYRVNAGYLPSVHWLQSQEEGGGRLVGELVHFLDWAVWLSGELPVRVHAVALPNAGRYSDDNLVITLMLDRGSVASIAYLANGDRSAGKERVEVHCGGRSAVLDDYRRLDLHVAGKRTIERQWLRADKGHAAEWSAFAEAVRAGRPSPIPFAEIEAVMRAAFAAQRSVRTGQPADVT